MHRQGSAEQPASTRAAAIASDAALPLTTVFGYRLRSELAFVSLRSGEGTPLDVIEETREPVPSGEPLMEWSGGGGPLVRLSQQGGSYIVRIERIGSFRIDPSAPRITMSGDVTGPPRETRLFGLPMALCFTHRGDLALHAAAVEVDGSALLLAGPGRHGKSTLAAAFMNEGFRPLSEDTTCYRGSPAPSIVPGAALMRIRPDVYEQLEFRHARVVAQDPDRRYLVADESARGDTSPVPLRGVLFLRRSDDDMRLERVPREAAFPDLWTLSFHFHTDQDRARCFGAIAELARLVPVWNLYRRLSFETLPQLVDHVIATCLPS